MIRNKSNLYFRYFLLICCLLGVVQITNGQALFTVEGRIIDAETGDLLPMVTVTSSSTDRSFTDFDGIFMFRNVPHGEQTFTFSSIGYATLYLNLNLQSDTLLNLHLHPENIGLKEIEVKVSKRINLPVSTLSTKEIDANFILQNNATNFVQTLAKLPGVSSMDIGAGFSKPVIRGLGFNRISVVDKGIIQQNQQWGADHGLEIDQFDVENVRIYKGPMSMFYGSDAIGGVIEIMPVNIPTENLIRGEISLIGKSNNDLLGFSTMMNIKKNRWFVSGRFTSLTFSDYRIPTDTIQYLTWKMPVYNRRMKNTAGFEKSGSISANYEYKRFNTWLHISDVYGKTGFYPGAHGIPNLNRLVHDGNFRNIEMPYSTTNHLKVISNNNLTFRDVKWITNIGFQRNSRQEIAKFHTHYTNQKAPENQPDLELAFFQNTYSLNSHIEFKMNEIWKNKLGISTEIQQNNIQGYSYLLPEYQRFSGGLFWLNSFEINRKLSLETGLRYDFGKLRIVGYFDNILSDYLQLMNYNENERKEYAQRALPLHKSFSNISANIGLKFIHKTYSLKVNLGKSFRYPTPNELASNGVHHGAFRHEKGNPELKVENGYQLDAEYAWKTTKFHLQVNPFVSFFDNYIYLNPTGKWSVLPHAGQQYEYEQASVFMTGSEAEIIYFLTEKWNVSGNAEYVYSLNTESGYALPFSPPFQARFQLEYHGKGKEWLKNYNISIENQWIAQQNRIAQNELKTQGAKLINFSANADWEFWKYRFSTNLQINNLFNTPYFNHLSFYRKLNAPEPGRNIQLIIKIPILFTN